MFLLFPVLAYAFGKDQHSNESDRDTCHLIRRKLVMKQPSNSRLVNEIAASEQNLLVFRALIFSVFPLVMAAGLLHTRGTPIDRATLRSPFFLQCYLAAPFAVVTSSAVALLRAHGPTYHVIGGVLLALALAWFVVVQTRWLYKQTGQGWGRAFGLALGYLLLALLLVALIGAAVVTA